MRLSNFLHDEAISRYSEHAESLQDTKSEDLNYYDNFLKFSVLVRRKIDARIENYNVSNGLFDR